MLFFHHVEKLLDTIRVSLGDVDRLANIFGEIEQLDHGFRLVQPTDKLPIPDPNRLSGSIRSRITPAS